MDKCPKCGAERIAAHSEHAFMAFSCGSWSFPGGSFVDSTVCLSIQLARRDKQIASQKAETVEAWRVHAEVVAALKAEKARAGERWAAGVGPNGEDIEEYLDSYFKDGEE